MSDDLNSVTGAIQDNIKTRQSRYEAAEFERRAEAMLAGHRQAPDGRNFMAFKMRDALQRERVEKYRKNFANTFPDAPGNEF